MMVINKTTYAEIGRKLRALPPEKTVASHEWEELVEKMCASVDDELHGTGVKELNELKKRNAQ